MPNCNKISATKFLRVALLLPTLMPGKPVGAQATSVAPPPRQSYRIHQRATIDDRVKAFARTLDLNQAQQAEVKTILQQRQQETLRIRMDSSISGATRIERFRALQDQTVERIRAVLNDDQKKKYNPLAVREIKPAPDQKSVEDWLKETTPKSPPSKQ